MSSDRCRFRNGRPRACGSRSFGLRSTRRCTRRTTRCAATSPRWFIPGGTASPHTHRLRADRWHSRPPAGVGNGRWGDSCDLPMGASDHPSHVARSVLDRLAVWPCFLVRPLRSSTGATRSLVASDCRLTCSYKASEACKSRAKKPVRGNDRQGKDCILHFAALLREGSDYGRTDAVWKVSGGSYESACVNARGSACGTDASFPHGGGGFTLGTGRCQDDGTPCSKAEEALGQHRSGGDMPVDQEPW